MRFFSIKTASTIPPANAKFASIVLFLPPSMKRPFKGTVNRKTKLFIQTSWKIIGSPRVINTLFTVHESGWVFACLKHI